MRGICKREEDAIVKEGLTPACAGNIRCSSAEARNRAAHPRRCGEYWLTRTASDGPAGSPPRMRGILYIGGLTNRYAGFTPACAGNIWHLCLTVTPIEAHPRVYGEYVSPFRSPTLPIGSPPHMRGILWPTRIEEVVSRITPRVCGDYSCGSYSRIVNAGSPPRMRGICRVLQSVHLPDRLTPAHTGNIGSRTCRISSAQAHPRVCGEYGDPTVDPCGIPGSPPRGCGEYNLLKKLYIMLSGSPPHARGISCVRRLPVFPSRLTPARARNISATCRLRSPVRAHPRVCGEYR